MNYFDHPYPRYGLATVLSYNDIQLDDSNTFPSDEKLAQLAAEYIHVALSKYRLHTEDKPQEDKDCTLRFRYVTAEDLATTKSKGQTSANRYYLAPHIATGDKSANRLINEARKKAEKLSSSKDLNKSVKLKRSFSPFTTKLNEGTKTLSNPKGTLLQAGFTLIATLTDMKPAAQVDFTNQVLIPNLPLKDLVRFIDLFDKMKGKESGDLLTRNLKAGNKNYRPPIYSGNYPYAPQSPIFGAVGLVGAMGQWARRFGHWEVTKGVLDKLVSRPLYMVSYDSALFKQVHLGHHVVRLAENNDLPMIINGLYHAQFYNPEHNKRDSKTRQLFYEMTSRFLQFYTTSSFQDFLAFRLEYPHSFSSILEDYFMSEKSIPKDIVQSAREYGNYLNRVSYLIGKDEAENKNTNRDKYEAKANILAQLESTAMSCKSPTALFAQLNVQAGRMSNMDVPAEASRFIEATNAGEVTLGQARDLILAYMRLRSNYSKTKDSSSSDEGTFSTQG